jgi:hypothetical protein
MRNGAGDGIDNLAAHLYEIIERDTPEARSSSSAAESGLVDGERKRPDATHVDRKPNAMYQSADHASTPADADNGYASIDEIRPGHSYDHTYETVGPATPGNRDEADLTTGLADHLYEIMERGVVSEERTRSAAEGAPTGVTLTRNDMYESAGAAIDENSPGRPGDHSHKVVDPAALENQYGPNPNLRLNENALGAASPGNPDEMAVLGQGEAPEYQIIHTTAESHNCLPAAFGQWLVVHAEVGDPQEKSVLAQDSDVKKRLFAILAADGAAPVTTFADLAGLSDEDRQVRLGKALRQLYFEGRTAEADANWDSADLAAVRDSLYVQLELLLETDQDQMDAAFSGMDFVKQQIANLQGEPEAKKTALKEWWHSDNEAGGYRQYILENGKPRVYLNEDALAWFGREFQVGIECVQHGNAQPIKLGSHELGQPTVTLYYNGLNHWSSYLKKEHVTSFNDTYRDNQALRLDNDEIKRHSEAVRKSAETGALKEQVQQIEDVYARLSQEFGGEKETDKQVPQHPDWRNQEDGWNNKTYRPTYDEKTKTLTCKSNIILTVSHSAAAPYNASDAKISAAADKEWLCVTASYSAPASQEGSATESKLNDQQIKRLQLKEIARLYSVAFCKEGMNKNNLAIDLKSIGSSYTEEDAVEAFKEAGFVYIAHKGVEKYKEEKKSTHDAEADADAVAGVKVSPSSGLLQTVKNNLPSVLLPVVGATALSVYGYCRDSEQNTDFSGMLSNTVVAAVSIALVSSTIQATLSRGFKVPQSLLLSLVSLASSTLIQRVSPLQAQLSHEGACLLAAFVAVVLLSSRALPSIRSAAADSSTAVTALSCHGGRTALWLTLSALMVMSVVAAGYSMFGGSGFEDDADASASFAREVYNYTAECIAAGCSMLGGPDIDSGRNASNPGVATTTALALLPKQDPDASVNITELLKFLAGLTWSMKSQVSFSDRSQMIIALALLRWKGPPTTPNGSAWYSKGNTDARPQAIDTCPRGGDEPASNGTVSPLGMAQ